MDIMIKDFQKPGKALLVSLIPVAPGQPETLIDVHMYCESPEGPRQCFHAHLDERASFQLKEWLSAVGIPFNIFSY